MANVLAVNVEKALRKVFPNSSFARDVTTVVGGTAFAQALSILVAPILSRLYSPADFGIFATVSGTAGTIAVVSSLTFESAIPIAKTDRIVRNLIYTSIATLVLTTAACLLAMLLLKSAIVRAINQDIPYWILLLCIPLIIVLALNQIANLTAIRGKQFGVIARTRLIQSLATIMVQVGGFLLGPVGLILGQIAGQVAGLTNLWSKSVARFMDKRPSLSTTTRTFKLFQRFPKYEAPLTLINSAGNYLPPAVLLALYGPTVAGLYALANRLLAIPFALIGSSSAQVFFSRASDAHRAKTLGTLILNTQIHLARLVAAPLIIGAIVAERTFAIIFGDAWAQAGMIVILMVPWIYAQFMGSTVSTTWIVVNRLRDGTIICTIGLVGRVATLALGYWIADWKLVLALFALWNAIFYFGVATYSLRLAGEGMFDFIREQVKILAQAALIAVPALAGRLANNDLLFILGVAASVLLLGFSFWKRMREFR